MKIILIALTFMLSANAMADTVEDCKRLEAFRANQQSKLILSRYGLGLINATQLKVLQDVQHEKMKAAVAQCGAQ